MREIMFEKGGVTFPESLLMFELRAIWADVVVWMCFVCSSGSEAEKKVSYEALFVRNLKILVKVQFDKKKEIVGLS